MCKWWDWHQAVPTTGLTSVDHRQPGERVARPTASGPTCTREPSPRTSGRFAVGSSKLARRSRVKAMGALRVGSRRVASRMRSIRSMPSALRHTTRSEWLPISPNLAGRRGLRPGSREDQTNQQTRDHAGDNDDDPRRGAFVDRPFGGFAQRVRGPRRGSRQLSRGAYAGRVGRSGAFLRARVATPGGEGGHSDPYRRPPGRHRRPDPSTSKARRAQRGLAPMVSMD
jgi:hypothetical protein